MRRRLPFFSPSAAPARPLPYKGSRTGYSAAIAQASGVATTSVAAATMKTYGTTVSASRTTSDDAQRT